MVELFERSYQQKRDGWKDFLAKKINLAIYKILGYKQPY